MASRGHGGFVACDRDEACYGPAIRDRCVHESQPRSSGLSWRHGIVLPGEAETLHRFEWRNAELDGSEYGRPTVQRSAIDSAVARHLRSEEHTSELQSR